MAREINLNHICKIEGHANLSLKIENNKVIACELQAYEGARFFEALVLNKNLEDVQEIVSRICGICSAAHSVAAVQALEEALHIKPTPQQIAIREMLMLGERIRSHATHLYFLALPDYFNASSALTLAKEHKSKIDDALALITLGNKIIETFGGREMHPFLKVKERMPLADFSQLLEQLKSSKSIILRTINLFANLDYPKFDRRVDCMSLQEPHHYATISGKIASQNSRFIDDDYKKHLTENIKEYATSKFVCKDGKPYVLGALARINNNHKTLDDETKPELKKVLAKLCISLPFSNPYHNNVCQALELLETVNKSLALLENMPDKQDIQSPQVKEGHGVSAVEAPRGTLFHEYKIDKTGKITYCNIITPTTQNLNVMEQDIIQLVNKLLQKKASKNQLINQIEKLIRSYDPCFSCSTHFLKVNWL